jgi:hypothetical protein
LAGTSHPCQPTLLKRYEKPGPELGGRFAWLDLEGEGGSESRKGRCAGDAGRCKGKEEYSPALTRKTARTELRNRRSWWEYGLKVPPLASLNQLSCSQFFDFIIAPVTPTSLCQYCVLRPSTRGMRHAWRMSAIGSALGVLSSWVPRKPVWRKLRQASRSGSMT